jgi:hypothetical protein
MAAEQHFLSSSPAAMILAVIYAITSDWPRTLRFVLLMWTVASIPQMPTVGKHVAAMLNLGG